MTESPIHLVFCWSRFAEISSGDDSGENSPDLSDHEEKVAEVDTAVNDHNSSNILIVSLVSLKNCGCKMLDGFFQTILLYKPHL